MGIISRAFYKPAQISLVREGQSFCLLAYYDGEPASIGFVVEKWPELRETAEEAADPGALRNEIPIPRLVRVRTQMNQLRVRCERNRKLSFYIPSEIEKVEILSQAPDWFFAGYRREGNALVRSLPEGVLELEDGWLRHQNAYWRYEGLSPEEQKSFGRTRIPEGDWVRFVTNDLPAYRAAGIRVESQIEYDDRRALALELVRCAEESIEVRTIWNVDRATVDESVSLDGFVLAADRIRPGLPPSAVQAVFPGAVATLQGQELASFLDGQYAAFRRWFSTDLSEFERMHSWIVPPYSWELVARSKLTRGVGKAYAHPVAYVGDSRLSVEELREMLQMPYARLPKGWVRRSDLLTLGMDEHARSADGAEIRPIRLDADSLLHRGGVKLGKLWSAMRCEGAEWIDGGDKHSCARGHLNYLLHWGINGGLIGGYEAMAAYGVQLFAQIAAREKGCKILLLARREDIRELSESFPYLESVMRYQNYVCMDYDAASRSMELNKRWDLLLMVEPDAYASEAEGSAIRGAAAISAACKIAFFAKDPCRDAALQSWDAGLLGYGANVALTDCLIRDSRSPKPLPKGYVFAPQVMGLPAGKPAREPATVLPMQGGGAEVILGEHARGGVAIPPRADAWAKVLDFRPEETGRAGMWENPHRAFFDEARSFAALEGDVAERVPFACYWPKYADMSVPQRNWYFYLRGCIRRGEYPETDVSYLFLYIYEVLNQIGVRDAAEGLQILLKLRRAYGGAYPSLCHHLDGWIYDYIHVYGCDEDAGELLAELSKIPERGLDALLTEMASRKELELPLWVLERLSGYRITGSKFYQRGNQELMNRCIPGALEEIDFQLRKKGKGLLDTYAALKMHNDTFAAFEGALVEEQRTYALRCRHYHSGLKLSAYLKNAVRYTENALRAQRKFGAKLQGIELDAKSKAWIDAYIARRAEEEAKSARTPAKIRLDLKKLDQLRADSDEVRDALIASMAEENPRGEVLEVERPEGAADGLLTDLAPVQGILSCLTAEQRAVLDCLAAHGWQADVHSLRERMAASIPEALVEEIDSVATSYLGCFLIEREGETFVVAEDYRDELEYLLPRRAQEAEAWRVVLDGLDEDWKSFLEQVDAVALGKLLEGMEAFREYARARGEMPELLLDDLNNLAADGIGDLIVDDDGIREDYLPIIQKHVVKG